MNSEKGVIQKMPFSNDLEETPSVLPDYSFIFPFERDFEGSSKTEWMSQHWHEAFYYIGIYLIVIFAGQAYMRSRQRLKLKLPLIVWNISLAIFSILGVCRTLPELSHVIREIGFRHSVCNSSYYMAVKVTGFWTWMFILSKVLELGDTAFIVLRKQQLIFLHWYHHITVLLFTWYSFANLTASGRWYIFMNYSAHSMMYTYYALRSMKIKVPRFVTIIITFSQIIQMVVGWYVSYFAFRAYLRGELCEVHGDVAVYGMLMYCSYFILFVKFFYQAYLTPRKEIKKVE